MSASEDEAPTPNLQPPALKSRRAAAPVAVVVVSVLLLVAAFLAVLFTIARVVTATASPG